MTYNIAREHGLPFEPNTDENPCLFCRDMYEPHLCTGCFKPYGIWGQSKQEKTDFHHSRDNHECLIPAMQAIAAEDTPQGRAKAAHLLRYTPMLPTPPTEIKRDKPSEEQIKIAAEALTNPIHIQRMKFQKQAQEAAKKQALDRKAEREAKTKKHPEYQSVPKPPGQSINPALKRLRVHE